LIAKVFELQSFRKNQEDVLGEPESPKALLAKDESQQQPLKGEIFSKRGERHSLESCRRLVPEREGSK